MGTSTKPLPYAIAASITTDLKQLLLAFPLCFHKPVVCLFARSRWTRRWGREEGTHGWGAQRWSSEGMVPKSAFFRRRQLDSLKLGQPDGDSSVLVIPGKKHELRRSMEDRKWNGKVEPRGCSWKHQLERSKMLPSRPDKRQLIWEDLKQGLCFLKQTEKSDFFFFFF